MEASSSPAPFLTKTYEMVDDPSTNDIVSWSPTNASFVVWNPPEFSRSLLPKYFKHNNFSSFIRQLNTYGFRKIDPEQWEFANEYFIRDQQHLFKHIHRRKPIHSHSLQGSGMTAETERQELEDEIDRLRQERSALIADLENHAQAQQALDERMQSLEDNLHNIENRQRILIDYLHYALQKPGLASSFVMQSDHFVKKRRLPKVDLFSEDVIMEENQNGSLLGFGRGEERLDILPATPMLDTEPFEKIESSLISLENFFRNVGQASGEEFYYDSIVCSPPAVVITEIDVSTADAEMSIREPSEPIAAGNGSEQAESASCIERPALELMEADKDANNQSSETDVISQHSAAPFTPSGSSATRSVENDVFWAQFLTETPAFAAIQQDKTDKGTMGTSEQRDLNHNNTIKQIVEAIGQLGTEKYS